jgi:hypothetical protein
MSTNKKRAGGARPLGGFHDHLSCCSVPGFEEEGCVVYLPTKQRGWICLSGDKYTGNHVHTSKLADLLFAWKVNNDNRLSCVLELKSGTISVSGVVGQLQQAAIIVDQLLRGMTVCFLPVLVHGPISTFTVRRLDNQKVSFRGERMRIHRLGCGGRVEDLKWSKASCRR